MDVVILVNKKNKVLNNKDDITKYSLKQNPQGHQKMGRPKIIWQKQTNKQVSELDLEDVEATTQDRREWRKLHPKGVERLVIK